MRRPHQRRSVANRGVTRAAPRPRYGRTGFVVRAGAQGPRPGSGLGARRWGRDPDVGHPAVAAAVDGLDDVLADAVVTQHPPGGLDPAGQRRLADEAVAPDGVEQLGLGDDPRAVRDEVAQHVEDLGLHVLGLPTALEQEPVGVEDDVPERVPHGEECEQGWDGRDMAATSAGPGVRASGERAPGAAAATRPSVDVGR